MRKNPPKRWVLTSFKKYGGEHETQKIYRYMPLKASI